MIRWMSLCVLTALLSGPAGAWALDDDPPPPVEKVEGEGNVAFILQMEDEAEGGFAVNPKGDEIAVGIDEWVCFFDPASGGRFRSWQTGRGQVQGMAWTPDGTKLIAGTRSGVFCFDVAAEKVVWSAQGHLSKNPERAKYLKNGSSNGVAVSGDGKRVASIEDEHTTLRIHDAATGTLLKEAEHGIAQASNILGSPDGKHFVVWSDWSKGGIACFRWSDLGEVWRHADARCEAAGAFNAGGSVLALGTSGGGGGTIVLLETTSGKKLGSHGPNGDFDIGGVGFTADGTRVVAA
ncbi:MAG: WD40 repeat domain-containing protein, partial [Planctomycetota bacterium]